MDTKKAIKILKDIKSGSEMCLIVENPKNKEDIEHYKNEVEAIEIMINSYNREKARADKLEREYSKMLTKIDEINCK